ncbi:hypothetical protein FW754_07855 [Acinetobacter sp. 1207_04]|uniref:hypothetical protein n=1 Tax=Acinetobacter sp. 1207_04 TaxID=2604449 RepID=UPI004059F623
MKLKTILAALLATTAINTWALDVDNPSLEDCKDNADTVGYMITIKAQCNLDFEDKDNELVKIINKLSKKCIAQYGEKSMANATRAGIFSAKEELEETGRNSTCYRALTEYPGLFD